jgi:hypothetical protein
LRSSAGRERMRVRLRLGTTILLAVVGPGVAEPADVRKRWKLGSGLLEGT